MNERLPLYLFIFLSVLFISTSLLLFPSSNPTGYVGFSVPNLDTSTFGLRTVSLPDPRKDQLIAQGLPSDLAEKVAQAARKDVHHNVAEIHFLLETIDGLNLRISAIEKQQCGRSPC